MPDYYKRNLPHIQPRGMIFFVTFRLYGSLPKSIITEFEADYKYEKTKLNKIENERQRNIAKFDHRKRSFAKWDELLDKTKNGPHYLKEQEVMQIVKDELHRFDGEYYDLVCYCIMSNHVHILIDTGIQEDGLEENDLFDNHIDLRTIMKRIKGPTARYINRHLNMKGKLWQKESWDTYIRDEKMFSNVIKYILWNPVKGGIVDAWHQYESTYIKYELKSMYL
jgi:putative transposase